ncbi:aminopeptidase N-like [Saccoglossus kowalevskii]
METSESQLALARLSSVISDNGAEVQFGQDGPASSTASTKIAIHSPNDTQPDENVAVKTFCNRRRCSCVLVTLLLFVVLVVMSVALALTSKQSGVPACVSLCNSTANESSAFPMTDVERENSTVSMNMTGYIWEESRLPFSVIPTFYQILLNIDISSRRFAGKVEIEILCQQTTNLLILHAHQINIENTVAMVMDLHTGANLTIIDRFQYALYQYDVIVLQEQLETNSRYLLTISNFSALLSENYENFAGGFGLYLSSYESPTNGTSFWMESGRLDAVRLVLGDNCIHSPPVVVVDGGGGGGGDTMATSPTTTQVQTFPSNNLNYGCNKQVKDLEVRITEFQPHANGLYLSRYKAAFLATSILLLCLAVVLLVVFVMKEPACIDGPIATQPPTKSVAAVLGDPSWHSYRLPTTLKPLFYRLELHPFIEKEYLSGRVEITLTCLRPTNFILLQSDFLEVTSATLESNNPAQHSPSIVDDPVYSEIYSYVLFKLDSDLVEGGQYTIHIEYSGYILSDVGLYRTGYIDDNGENRYLAASFLSPVSARKVFPCFDEPSFKANFSITLIHEAKYIALSNMPEKLSPYGKEKRQDGLIATHFETTPKMSTYLLAFIVCDFAHRATVSNHGRVEFRVWARKGAMDQVAYALDIGPKIFTYLENYASIPYSLPKMDMIALPSLVATGMENWGLNTFRENVLLYKEELSSSRDKQWIALLIGHELSHQWHSNLVTQAWWDELWLKEGFATFMGLKAVDYVHPDYQMVTQQFLCDDLHNVFLLDSLSTSHPVNQHVDTPSEILDNFDMIAYQKGSALVRMMYFFLGEETFTQGLFKYLNDNAYGSATSQDLWVAMDWAAKKNDLPVDVPTVMDRWLLQMGYPLVTITRDYRNKRATISQRHFLIDKGINGTVRESPYDYSWHIPVTYTYGGKERFSDAFQTWLITEKKIVDLSSVDNDEWVVANVNQTYYYRVNYDMDNWNLIIDQLKTNHEDISVSQRAALIDDAFNLAKSGELSQIIGFRLTEYLRNETEYLPWRTAMRVLGHIDQLLGHTVAYGVFQKYMLKQVEWLYEKVGWNDTGLQLERYHRITILGVACRYGHAGCIQKASDLYADWMEGRISIAPNLQKIVICGGIAAGGLEEWDYAWQMYKESNVASEKLMFLEALACSGELWILSRYLERTLDTNEIPLMLALDVYKSVSSNHLGSYLMWDFFREKWSIIVNRYAGGLFQIAPLVESITSSFDTETKLQELQLFIDTHVTKKEDIDSGVFAGGSSFLSAIDKTKANINWLKSNQSPVREWLLEASR